MSKRAILYARVSTKGQKENHSLPFQLEAMRDYCKQHGFKVIDELSDVHTGNSAVADRPSGAKVYAYLQRRAVDIVLLFTLDRTARDDDAIEYAIFKRDVKRAGAELHFVDTGRVADDLMGGMIEQFKAVGAADERRKIAKRMSDGRKARAAGGQYVGSGDPPYGYQIVGQRKDSRLEIIQAEAAVVLRIFEMYAGLRSKALELRAIARILTQEGVPPPNRMNRKKPSRVWYGETLRKIIRRRAYAFGEFPYGDQTIVVPNTAFIEPKLWRTAQDRLERNKLLQKRNRQHHYLLAGHFKCKCGGAITGRPKARAGAPALYYRCNRRAMFKYADVCDELSLRVEPVDKLVWDWLSGLLKDRKRLEAGLDEYERRQKIERKPKQDRLEAVQEIVRSTERQVNQLAQDLRFLKNERSRAAIHQQLDEAGQTLEGAIAERNQLVSELEQGRLSAEDRAEILAIADEIRQGLQDGDVDFETMRWVLDRLKVEVKIEYRKKVRGLHMRCALKFGEKWLPTVNSVSTAEAVMEVPGIGEGKFAAIEDLITV